MSTKTLVVEGRAEPNQHQQPRFENKPKPHINLIPNEILEQILEKLPLEDKKSTRLVCTRWSAVQERHRSYNIELSSETLPYFHKREYNLNELKVILNTLKFPEKIPGTMEASIQKTKKLLLMANDYVESYSTVLDGGGIARLLTACKKTHTLVFDFKYMETYKMTSELILTGLQLQFLTTLELKLAYGGSTIAVIIGVLLAVQTPCLRNLAVERFALNGLSATEWDEMNPALMRCLVRNKTTLRSLKLVQMFSCYKSRSNSYIRNMFDLAHQLDGIQLEYLEIHQKTADHSELWLGMIFMAIQQRSLKVFMFYTDSINTWVVAERLIIANGPTLTHLKLNLHRLFLSNANFLNVLTSLTDLSVSHNNYVGPFSSTTLQRMTWNAPIPDQWLNPEDPPPFPSLISVTFGKLARNPMLFNFKIVCDVLFENMNLKWITVVRKPVSRNRGRRGNNYGYFEAFDSSSLYLVILSQVYRVEYAKNLIHISLAQNEAV